MATRVVCEFHLQSLIWIWRCLNTHMSNSVGILNVLLKVLMQYRTLCSFLNTTLVNNCTLIATSLSRFMVSPLRVRVYSFKHLCIIFPIIRKLMETNGCLKLQQKKSSKNLNVHWEMVGKRINYKWFVTEEQKLANLLVWKTIHRTITIIYFHLWTGFLGTTSNVLMPRFSAPSLYINWAQQITAVCVSEWHVRGHCGW